MQIRLAGRLSLLHTEYDRVLQAVPAQDGAEANATMLTHMSMVEEAFETRNAGQAEERAVDRALGRRAVRAWR